MDFIVTVTHQPYIGLLQSYEATWILHLLASLVIIFAISAMILKRKLDKRRHERDFFISRYYDAKFGLPDKAREDATRHGHTDIIKILDSWEATFERMGTSLKNKRRREKHAS